VLFQPCHSCSSLVTLKMSCSVSMSEVNADDDNEFYIVKADLFAGIVA